MGLFDFLKRTREDTANIAAQNSNTNSEVQSSVFKGDLAKFHGVPVATRKNTNTCVELSIDHYESKNNTDNADSEVFMTFPKCLTDYWSCPECGTLNNMNMTGCIVCGLKK